MNQKTSIVFALVVIILIASVFGLIFWFTNTDKPNQGVDNIIPLSNRNACTEEAKICPDGSAVGRTGPNCDFAPCPKEIENPMCKNICGDGACQERVCMGTGCPCPETAKSCPQDCTKNPDDDLKSCQTDNDCDCGVEIGTHTCFYGNKKYVNTANQCPDFCGGFDGSMRIKCVNDVCIQQSVFSDPDGSNCPQYAPPAPGWCSDGTITAPVKNSDGCYGPSGCAK